MFVVVGRLEGRCFPRQYGDKRCIVAACVFLRQAVFGPRSGPGSELWWLSTLLEPGRVVAPILQELLAHYRLGAHAEFIPTNYPDLVITMAMQGFISSWATYVQFYPNASNDVDHADCMWPADVWDTMMMDAAALPSPNESDHETEPDEWVLHQFLNPSLLVESILPSTADEAADYPVVPPDAVAIDSDDDLDDFYAPPVKLSFAEFTWQLARPDLSGAAAGSGTLGAEAVLPAT